jgi:hypothetical protein
MLLLTGSERTFQQLLIEVKDKSNNAWYGAVENLRQLRLFSESEVVRRVFHTRCEGLDLPVSLPVTAITLGPPAFYSTRGQKGASVAPAQELLQRMHDEVKVEAHLATWDENRRVIDFVKA